MEKESQVQAELIDFRSDVLSKPSKEMLKAMSEAEVGDDVFNDDPTANKFQERISRLFNKEAALFFPSASMGCLASVINHCRQGEEMIIWGNSHAVDRQCSSYAMFAGVLTRQVFSEDGLFDPQEISKMIRRKEDLMAYPDTTMVFAENPTFTGKVYPLQHLKQLKKVCEQKGVHLHIDGARIFYSLARLNIEPKQIGDTFDSMTICLSKGLCCPIGAVVVGDRKFIDRLLFVRKSLGGGMRQIGLLCAAADYALDHMVPQIKKDLEISQKLSSELSKLKHVKIDIQVNEINMVNFNITKEDFDHKGYVEYLLKNGIQIKKYNEDLQFYRLMIYRQIREKAIEKFVKVTRQFLELQC